ncbi:MAG: hypothetical protein ACKO0Z_08615 [Betaproteobacteria bacterium]
MQDPFNPAQRQALQQAYSLLGEHFDRALIVVDAELDGDDGANAHEVLWKGGYMAALGMAEYARCRMINKPPE